MYIKQKNADVFVNLEGYSGNIEDHPALFYPTKEDSAFELVSTRPEKYDILNFQP